MVKKMINDEISDDYGEHTFYSIDPYKNEGNECNGIFIQLLDVPTRAEFEAFIKRASAFPKFLETTSGMSNLKNIKLIDMCVTKEKIIQEKIM